MADIQNKTWVSYKTQSIKPFSFEGFSLTNLPSFYTNKIVDDSEGRFTDYLEANETVYNTLYTKIKNLYNNFDIGLAPPKALYNLGQLLGLTELVDLTNSTDWDKIENQRNHIRTTITRLLSKGTVESIVKLLYGLNIDISIKELWTRDFSTFFELDNYTKFYKTQNNFYDGEYPDNVPQYYTGYASEDLDILSTLSISFSGSITDIEDYKTNNFGYTYIATNAGLFFQDDSGVWYRFNSTSVSFKLYNDNIYILDGTTLKVYGYNNLFNLKFSIDDVSFFDILDFNSYGRILIDDNINGNIVLRSADTYEILDTLIKINSNVATKFFNNISDDYIVFNENDKEFYQLDFADINSTMSFPVSGAVDYSLSIPVSGSTYIDKMEDNKFLIFNNDGTVNTATILELVGDTPFFTENTLTNLTKNITDVITIQKDDRFVYLTATEIGIYNLNNLTEDISVEFADKATHTYSAFIKQAENERFVIKNDGSKDSLLNFYAFSFYDSLLIKTHYFDVFVDLLDLADFLETFDLDQGIIEVTDLIKKVQPGHTTIRDFSFTLNMGEDISSISDSVSAGVFV
jgi:molybdopterin-guanine dinucleotide biosynthesis protein A